MNKLDTLIGELGKMEYAIPDMVRKREIEGAINLNLLQPLRKKVFIAFREKLAELVTLLEAMTEKQQDRLKHRLETGKNWGSLTNQSIATLIWHIQHRKEYPPSEPEKPEGLNTTLEKLKQIRGKLASIIACIKGVEKLEKAERKDWKLTVFTKFVRIDIEQAKRNVTAAYNTLFTTYNNGKKDLAALPTFTIAANSWEAHLPAIIDTLREVSNFCGQESSKDTDNIDIPRNQLWQADRHLGSAIILLFKHVNMPDDVEAEGENIPFIPEAEEPSATTTLSAASLKEEANRLLDKGLSNLTRDELARLKAIGAQLKTLE